MKCPKCQKQLSVIDTLDSIYYICHYEDDGCGYITFEKKKNKK